MTQEIRRTLLSTSSKVNSMLNYLIDRRSDHMAWSLLRVHAYHVVPDMLRALLYFLQARRDHRPKSRMTCAHGFNSMFFRPVPYCSVTKT